MLSSSRKLHLVSLGCPKNRVDSEVLLGVAMQHGFEHTSQADQADLIVINTCGFIDAAKQESINTILELAAMKHSGRCKQLVVTGCLSQRYSAELSAELPEVDHFLGSSDMLKLGQVLRGGAARLLVGTPADWLVQTSDPRVVTTPGSSAYLKISEGCNRSCAFCVIPAIRGKQRSRSLEDVVREAELLASRGVVELNLVSQDTVAYGQDLSDGRRLAELVERVAEVQGIQWVRLFYLYPEKLSEPVLELIAHHPVVVPYVDMPLQHAATSMLKRMRRGYTHEKLKERVDWIRKHVPDVVFRTAFIVGHPGETEAEFEQLCELVRWAEFDRVGVFQYSDEEDAASYALGAKVPAPLTAFRAEHLMEIQRPISRAKNEAMVGKQLTVLVEGPSAESDLVMQGRHPGQAPDIDGVVYLSGGLVYPGQLCRATVSQASDYDLVADVAETDEEPLSARPLPRVGPQVVVRSTDGRRVTLRTVP